MSFQNTLQVAMNGECIILTKTDDTKRGQKIEGPGGNSGSSAHRQRVSWLNELPCMGGISRKAGSVRGWTGYRVSWNGEKSNWLTSNKPIIMSSNASHVAGNAWRMPILTTKRFGRAPYSHWSKSVVAEWATASQAPLHASENWPSCIVGSSSVLARLRHTRQKLVPHGAAL